MKLHIPWKKIGQGIRKGLAIGAQFDPRVAYINSLVVSVEQAAEETPLNGPDKLAVVENVSDAVLDKLKADPEKIAAIKNARRVYIDTFVAAKHAEAAVEDAHDKLKAAFDDAGVGMPSAPDADL